MASSQRRVLVLAAAAFVMASVYLCTTRLFNMSFTLPPAWGSGAADVHDVMADETQLLDALLDAAPDPGPADLPMYGEYGRPALDDLTLVAPLPRDVVPSPANRRRLVVVGDIHGMDANLARLLAQVRFNWSTDHLVAAGDMVTKGPASPAVVARLMALGASAARGNNDDRVLLARAEAAAAQGLSADLASPEAERRRGEAKHLIVARSLAPDQADWLSRRPVILTAHPLPIYIVHAGLVPRVPLEKQDPWAVMNMRTLIYPREELRKKETQQDLRRRDAPPEAPPAKNADDDDYHHHHHQDDDDDDPDRAVAIPVEDHSGEPWSDAWNRHQRHLPAAQRRTVVYGHNAKRGLALGPHTFGLDSGCVRGGALTAMIIEAADSDADFKYTMSQVPCHRARKDRAP